MEKENQPRGNRRHTIKLIIGLTSMMCFPAPFVITPSRAAPKRISIRNAGGILTQVYAEAFYKPFTQATGIEIVNVASEPEPTAQIRTMVETKRYLWDMVSISQRAILSLTASNVYLEKHGLEHDPVISSIPPQFMSPYGVGGRVYSTVLAYRTDAFKGRPVPASWKDVWDTDHFPGRRGLSKYPVDTVEIALMADGVPPAQVYPCNLDRAFRNLDKIKPHVAVWWTSGPQTEELLKSGEIDLTPVWTPRVQTAINAGAPIMFLWEQHIYRCEGWAILKGTPHADACRQFIQFAAAPKRQALLASIMSGPTQPDAFKYIDPKHAKLLPTYPDNLNKGLRSDDVYWAKHQQAATERFNHWLVS